MSEQYEGAWVTISYPSDNGWEHDVYISFGTFDADTDTDGLDSFGTPDEDIFYYSTYEELLEMLKQAHTGEPRKTEWLLISINDLLIHN